MLYVELQSYNPASGYMGNGLVAKFIYKGIDTVVMAKNDNRFKPIVQGLYGFYKVTVN